MPLQSNTEGLVPQTRHLTIIDTRITKIFSIHCGFVKVGDYYMGNLVHVIKPLLRYLHEERSLSVRSQPVMGVNSEEQRRVGCFRGLTGDVLKRRLTSIGWKRHLRLINDSLRAKCLFGSIVV